MTLRKLAALLVPEGLCDFDRPARIEPCEQQGFQLLLDFTLLVGTDQLANILTRAAVAAPDDLGLHR